MSDIIKLLPDSVANQIAAGEVIQRPSSVIKELVENAIDAGATSIQVIVVDAGKTCIQVVDNGKGMSETDARLAFERHATSKITQASDLFNLQTMGFRGEALASIAAVAQVELKTRTADEEIGTCLQIEGSKVIDQQPDACSVGANFSVKNLFYNIPARRKFLKSNQTEMSNILTEFERVALANPQLSFKLYSGDSVLQNLPAGNFRSRIRGIFGKNVDSKLLPVSVETSLAKINGYVGTPESSKKKGFHQYFFVNGRYMKHPYFSKAIMTAYERLIPDNEQVSYFIDFQVDPSKIDVNIHPAKTEIKFEDDSAIWQILLASVREALGKFNAIPTLDFDTENCPSIPAFNPEYTEVKQPQVHLDSSFNPFDQPQEVPLSENGSGAARRDAFSRSASGWENAFAKPSNLDFSLPLGGSNSQTEGSGESSSDFANFVHGSDAQTHTPLFDAAPMSPKDTQMPGEEMLWDNGAEEDDWKELSASAFQYNGRFIVLPSSSGVVLIDQHRAHVRVLYDMFLNQLLMHKGVSQGLLFPELLQLPLSSATHFEALMEQLAFVGFDISPLGAGSFSILGIPSGTEGLDVISLLQSILDETMQGKPKAEETIAKIIANRLAQQAAMPVGQILGRDEITNLVVSLFASENPHYTPNGKNIQYLLDTERIKQLFDA